MRDRAKARVFVKVLVCLGANTFVSIVYLYPYLFLHIRLVDVYSLPLARSQSLTHPLSLSLSLATQRIFLSLRRLTTQVFQKQASSVCPRTRISWLIHSGRMARSMIVRWVSNDCRVSLSRIIVGRACLEWLKGELVSNRTAISIQGGKCIAEYYASHKA